MARKRTTSAAHARQPRQTTRKRLAAASTILPLALGLASSKLPSGQPSPAPSTRTTHVTHVSAGTFSPVCNLPFDGVRNSNADDHCGIQGGSNDPSKQAESRAKNNFCAATHPPDSIAYDDLIQLQTQAGKNIPKNLPDRSILTGMGEGRYVSYIAFVKDAHYSDVSKGEAVNCNIPGDSTNDIHIILLKDPADDECESTTAEMSPHYRPLSWTPDNVKSAGKHPVRVQGQLFYDGSHSPCTATSSPNPQRKSLWEIHPVYAFDVCKMTDLTQCQSSTNPADWVPLDQWVSSEQE